MKTRYLLLTLLALTLMTLPAFAMDKDHDSHGNNKIHMSSVNGYTFNYELIDMTENLKKLKGDHATHAMKASHHLMVFIKGDQDLKGAKVGFLLTDTDGKTHKAMAMGMGGGFGADLPMMKKGDYKIKTKVVSGETKLIDEFTYHMH